MQDEKELLQDAPAQQPVVEAPGQEQEIELAENAFRPLKEGEKYVPILRPEKSYPEVTPYSVSMGLIMAVIFSAAAAYLGLKVGQVFEAAIPIGRERDHPVHWRCQRHRRGRCHLHATSPLHPAAEVSRDDCQLPRGVPQLVAWRHPGHFVLHPIPQVLR